MILAQDGATCPWVAVNWQTVTVGLQILALVYLVYAFRRIARNQAEIADYIREKLGKGE